MSSLPIRCAIVGAGVMGRWHADAAARLGARVAAVVDRDRGRAASIARRYAGCLVATDVDSALEAADVFHVCTPTASHVELATRILTAGRHALVEKPLAPDRAQTRQLLDLAAAHGVLLCPVHQFVFQPGVQRALANIRVIAPIRDLQMTFWSAGARGRPDAADAVAFEILPHPLSLLVRFLGLDVEGAAWTVLRPGSGELRVHACVGTTFVSVRISMNARPTTSNAVLAGEKGTVMIDLFHGFSICLPGAVSRTRKILQPFHYAATTLGAAAVNLGRRAARREPAYPGLRELVARVYAAIDGRGPAPIDPSEALAVAHAGEAIADALRRSGLPA